MRFGFPQSNSNRISLTGVGDFRNAQTSAGYCSSYMLCHVKPCRLALVLVGSASSRLRKAVAKLYSLPCYVGSSRRSAGALLKAVKTPIKRCGAAPVRTPDEVRRHQSCHHKTFDKIYLIKHVENARHKSIKPNLVSGLGRATVSIQPSNHPFHRLCPPTRFRNKNTTGYPIRQLLQCRCISFSTLHILIGPRVLTGTLR